MADALIFFRFRYNEIHVYSHRDHFHHLFNFVSAFDISCSFFIKKKWLQSCLFSFSLTVLIQTNFPSMRIALKLRKI